ncbi:hypothetical protein LY76DRAFT_142393 [Colletotrichum caudatum]|nr:hypothetical protein LY76DRAFT_142393 [Colletotrichum caudatum]
MSLPIPTCIAMTQPTPVVTLVASHICTGPSFSCSTLHVAYTPKLCNPSFYIGVRPKTNPPAHPCAMEFGPSLAKQAKLPDNQLTSSRLPRTTAANYIPSDCFVIPEVSMPCNSRHSLSKPKSLARV